MAISAAQQAEIERKAAAGIPLTNPTAESLAAYEKAKSKSSASAVSAATTAEIKRKAAAGIPLTNPTAVTTAIYNAAKTAAKAVSSAVNPTSSTGSLASGKTQSERQAQRDKYTGWDNDPSVRTLQEQSWDIYVATGKWNTAEQTSLHKQAEQARQYNNPMYGGSDYGPTNWIEAEKITPRDTTPNANSVEGMLDTTMDTSNWGGYAKAGIGIVFLFLIMSMFRRR